MTRKVLICILALLFFSSVAFAGTKLIQQAAIPDDTALTVAGGATPYVDGYNLDLSDMAPLSKAFLFLRNEGTSTSLSVTYKTGFVDADSQPTGDISYITPITSKGTTPFTAFNIANSNGSEAGDSFLLEPAQYYKFRVTNNDATAGHTATVSLYLLYLSEL